MSVFKNIGSAIIGRSCVHLLDFSKFEKLLTESISVLGEPFFLKEEREENNFYVYKTERRIMQYHEPQQKLLREAFRTDCQTLITRFELSYNTHFQNFCEIWKEMQFSLVFAYHPSELTLALFCEDALCIIKQFLVNASSLKERIGALYLTYGVYYKIPVKGLKIRMSLSDWKCLMELHSQIKEEEYLDANYILCKLIVDRIFIHCLSDREYGIERHFFQKQEQPKLDVNLMPEIKELASPEKLLSTISKLSKIYEEKKRALYDAEGDSSLQLYDANMADNIVNEIRTTQSTSRIFVKSNISNAKCNYNKPSTSSALPLSETVQKSQKRVRMRKKIILAKIGQAFEKGLQSEDESVELQSEDSSEEK